MENSTRLHPIEKEAAKQVAESYTFGDVIPHAEIDRLLGINVPDGPISASKHRELSLAKLSRFDGLREMLLENSNMLLTSVRGEGYRICQPAEQTSYAMNEVQKRITKNLRKAAKALVNVEVSMLTQADIQKNIDARGRLSMIANMTQRSKMLKGVQNEMLAAPRKKLA